MNDTYIVTTFVVIDDILQALDYRDDSRTQMTAAEILTIAVLAAKYFQNHHERALYVLAQLGYVPAFSVSRFNRRLHELVDGILFVSDPIEVRIYGFNLDGELMDWLDTIFQIWGRLASDTKLFIIDSSPLPVCRKQRAERCRKLAGQAWGYCASHKTYYFGFKLHLLCTVEGIPVSFDVLPAAHHDLCAVQHVLADLPPGAWVLADKAYNSAKDEQLAWVHGRIRLIPVRRANMIANDARDAHLLRKHRYMIETVHSQLQRMGVQRLHARTINGFAIKLLASLLALTFTNAFK